MKKDITTTRLSNILKDVHTDRQAEKFIRQYAGKSPDATLHDYLNSMIAEKDLKISDLIRRSGLNENYAYPILNGRKNPARDKVLALCIACGMSIKETNHALKLADKGSLHPKYSRDAYIMICINNGMTDVTEVNLYLDSKGQTILDV